MDTRGSSILAGRSGAEIAFTDRAGRHWIRRALGGNVEPLQMDPFAHFRQFGLYPPYELETPEKIS